FNKKLEGVAARLDVELPRIIIPVRPGRNLSIIIEVAAMNQRLKKSGYHTAREFNKTLISWLQNGEVPRRP
ncbi:MAG: hypothetical protein HGA76_10425, partial [Candidatus Firestonebacteria bacterium]|nr:hypothetical protein [Candidatus Firestonebacteria bacterium]